MRTESEPCYAPITTEYGALGALSACAAVGALIVIALTEVERASVLILIAVAAGAFGYGIQLLNRMLASYPLAEAPEVTPINVERATRTIARQMVLVVAAALLATALFVYLADFPEGLPIILGAAATAASLRALQDRRWEREHDVRAYVRAELSFARAYGFSEDVVLEPRDQRRRQGTTASSFPG